MWILYQSLRYTHSAKKSPCYRRNQMCSNTPRLVSHWFNSAQLAGYFPCPEQQAEEVCLTFNLFVRQCENGVMKRNSRGLRANKVFRGKIFNHSGNYHSPR